MNWDENAPNGSFRDYSIVFAREAQHHCETDEHLPLSHGVLDEAVPEAAMRKPVPHLRDHLKQRKAFVDSLLNSHFRSFWQIAFRVGVVLTSAILITRTVMTPNEVNLFLRNQPIPCTLKKVIVKALTMTKTCKNVSIAPLQ